MQSETKKNMQDLKKRSMKRSISFSTSKTIKDAKVENDFFKSMKDQIYAQIVRK